MSRMKAHRVRAQLTDTPDCHRLLPYLNGRHTIDEIVYREEMRRRELRALLQAFSADIITVVHP